MDGEELFRDLLKMLNRIEAIEREHQQENRETDMGNLSTYGARAVFEDVRNGKYKTAESLAARLQKFEDGDLTSAEREKIWQYFGHYISTQRKTDEWKIEHAERQAETAKEAAEAKVKNMKRVFYADLRSAGELPDHTKFCRTGRTLMGLSITGIVTMLSLWLLWSVTSVDAVGRSIWPVLVFTILSGIGGTALWLWQEDDSIDNGCGALKKVQDKLDATPHDLKSYVEALSLPAAPEPTANYEGIEGPQDAAEVAQEAPVALTGEVSLHPRRDPFASGPR